ncbi:ABC transporter permease [Iamia majanohamensis]|uniref:ABC transporter permease n=2 Tax=Iamia majanohamensis TaxID=467976 RepID=A0AAE9Y659_9ACTN|nr:ABC transporter permease [Iamia majanohamensis]WCO65008.1 ABC transporter permease [Iamia majanohamensis]
MAAARTSLPSPEARRARPSLPAWVERTAARPIGAVLGSLTVLYDMTVFAGRIAVRLPRALKYRKEIAKLISDMTIGAGAVVVGGGMVLVIFFLAFFTGTEVGLQGFTALEQIGAESFSGVISSVGNTREITPLIAGVGLAAQVGAGFTAQLGSMRISDEVDALEVMSVDSMVYLVCTRVWAALITMVPLYLVALFSSFLATKLIVTRFFTLSSGVYDHYFQLFLPPIDIFYSFTKAIVFAVAVTLIHCWYGYYATGGPAGVGRAAGRAIRASIIAVTVLNLVLSLVFYGDQDTARIVGMAGLVG